MTICGPSIEVKRFFRNLNKNIWVLEVQTLGFLSLFYINCPFVAKSGEEKSSVA